MNSFWGNIFGKADASDLVSLLKDVPVFADLSTKELSLIERIAHERSYGPGESIFHQGDPGTGMYVIRQGRVSIVSSDETVLGELGGGEFFGEIAILNETPRSATARAETPVSILAFFKADLFQLIDDNPRLGVKVLKALASIAGERLVHANDRIEAFRHTSMMREPEVKRGESTIGI